MPDFEEEPEAGEDPAQLEKVEPVFMAVCEEIGELDQESAEFPMLDERFKH